MGKKKAVKRPMCASNRAGHAQVQDNDGNIYIIGGYNDSGLLKDIWKYDATGVWSQCSVISADNPLPRVDFAACMLNNDIYLFGGVVTNDDEVLIMNDMWRYSIIEGIWRCEIAECSVSERGGHVMVAVDENRALIHGGECMRHLGDSWIFDSRSKQFQEIVGSGPVPSPRSSHAAVYNCTLHFVAIFGGHTLLGDGDDMTPAYLNDLWILHVDTLSWSFIPFAGLAPSPRDLPALVTQHQRLFILGGYGYEEESSDDDEEEEEGEEDVEQPVEQDEEVSKPVNSPAAASEEVSDAIASLNISNSDAHAPSAPSLHINEATEENCDEDDDSVTMSYLRDIWTVDIHTHETSEASVVLANGKRGCHMSRLTTGKIVAFGGFNGQEFFGLDASISMDDLIATDMIK